MCSLTHYLSYVITIFSVIYILQMSENVVIAYVITIQAIDHIQDGSEAFPEDKLIYKVVFTFVSKSLLRIKEQMKLKKKIAILSRKPRSHVWILRY